MRLYTRSHFDLDGQDSRRQTAVRKSTQCVSTAHSQVGFYCDDIDMTIITTTEKYFKHFHAPASSTYTALQSWCLLIQLPITWLNTFSRQPINVDVTS